MFINNYQNLTIFANTPKKEHNLTKNVAFSLRNKTKKTIINMNLDLKNDDEKQKLGPEKIFFEGPPSKVELIIPFFFPLNCHWDYPLYNYSFTTVLGKL